MDKFWFVWNENGKAPTYKHDTLDSAKKEAERLALLHHTQKFIVLESVEYCYINNPVIWMKTDEIPF